MRKLISILAGISAGLVLSSAAWACNTLSDGEVSKVDAAARQVTVASGAQKHIFTTSDSTKVIINGKESRLVDLRAGDKVTVDYESATDVLAIKVTREG